MRNPRSPCELLPLFSIVLISGRHTFGADVHRFKHSFLGRLDLAAELPGPGWYAPLQIPEKKDSRDKAHPESQSPGREAPVHATGVFKMTGPQCADIRKPVEHRPPGPGVFSSLPSLPFSNPSLSPKSLLISPPLLSPQRIIIPSFRSQSLIWSTLTRSGSEFSSNSCPSLHLPHSAHYETSRNPSPVIIIHTTSLGSRRVFLPPVSVESSRAVARPPDNQNMSEGRELERLTR
jgi:hypothetical protein